jgi:hypothetical protein
MNPESFQTACQVVTLVSAVIVALGAFGNAYFGNRAERVKAERNQNEQTQLRHKIDDLAKGNEGLLLQLQPFVEIARERYPGLGTDKGLEQIQASLRHLEQRTTELAASVQPRQLSEEQIAALVRRLSGVTKAKVHIIRPSGDQEVARLTEQIKKVLGSAGWPIEKDLVDLTGTPRSGLVLFASTDPPNPSVRALYIGLEAAQLGPLQLIRDTSLTNDVIGIQVGAKVP